MSRKEAMITGITGQDGSYLAEYLISKGYKVHGIIRNTSTFNAARIHHIYKDVHEADTKLFLHYADLTDSSRITNLISDIQPDEIYHLAAQSHVGVSFEMPTATGDITALAATRVLEAIRRCEKPIRFYQASSSEMFGATPPPQSEDSAFYPRSPYAVAKVYAYWITVNFREAYDIFASNGILFNHESPRRGDSFVTRKITIALAQILAGRQSRLYLGNIHAKRDWGFAPEYVEAIHKIMQHDQPDDFVLGTGETWSVKEFIETAAEYLDIGISWEGEGVDEIGTVSSAPKNFPGALKTGHQLIRIDPDYFRPTEVQHLRADITKVKKALDWEPRVSFTELVKVMVDYDLMAEGLEAPGEGIKIIKEKGLDWTDHKMS